MMLSVLTRLRRCRTLSGNAALELAQGFPRAQRKKDRKNALCNEVTYVHFFLI